MLEAGALFLEYRLVRSIATGGRGDLWLADNPSRGLSVLRALNPASEAGLVERIDRLIYEIRDRTGYDFARLFHIGKERNLWFSAAEFVEGVDLRQLIARFRRSGSWPSPTTSVALIARAANIVAHTLDLDQGQFWIRGLCASNVLVGEGGSVRFTDLARSVVPAAQSTARRHLYSSPEEALDAADGDPRSNVFTLGALLYELVTRIPYDRGKPFRKEQVPGGVPESLGPIFELCLDRDRKRRFPDAYALLHALRPIYEGHPDAQPAAISRLLPKDAPATSDAFPAAGGPSRSREGPRPSDPPDIGSRFTLLGRIGEGGMGEVYRALDVELNEVVALKMISRNMIGDRELIERMRREVRLARSIVSPHVCRIHDLVEFPGGGRGVSMAFLKGRTIAQLLREGVPVDYRRFTRWGEDIARGLSAAHALSIVHRDLKPENIMISEEDRAVILDFGVAYSNDQAVSETKLTQKGVILGTLPYMAPEQLTASDLDGRSDLYSLGLILAELITGEIPFAAKTYNGVLERRVLKPSVFDLSQLDGAAPPALAKLLEGLLAADRAARPSNALEVAERLRQISELPRTRALPIDDATPAPTTLPPAPAPPVSPPPFASQTQPDASASGILTAPPGRVPAAIWAGLVSLALGLVVAVALGEFLGGSATSEALVEPLPSGRAPIPAEAHAAGEQPAAVAPALAPQEAVQETRDAGVERRPATTPRPARALPDPEPL